MAAISALANLVLTVGDGIFLGLGAALGVDANRQLILHPCGKTLGKGTYNLAGAM